MTAAHQELVAAAKSAIDAVFDDTTVSQAQTRESLEELIEDIRGMIETLEP